MSLKFDTNNLNGFISESQLNDLLPKAQRALHDLHHKSGAGSEFLGWVDLPDNIQSSFLDELEVLAKDVQSNSDVVISIGIGGSYLGIRSTLEAIGGAPKVPVLYAGQHMSVDDMNELLRQISGKRVTIVVISKSGTTTEPALAFRILKEVLAKQYSEQELKQRIICVTDASKGALRKQVDEKGYRSFIIPDDVGGRFSILTPVGLVPLAIAGVDIKALVKGAFDARRAYEDSTEHNDVLKYAMVRNILYSKGKVIEMMASFYPRMASVIEWWKQLYGESEGKGGEGIFPASTILSTDLHSMGQLMQDGKRNIFETFLMVGQSNSVLNVPADAANLDNFNCVAGKDLDYVNKQAYLATAAAHLEGGVPNMTITIDQADAYNIGWLYYFFELGVGVSGYILGVNPFDQPGVEAYKSKMFTLLGRV